MSDIIEGGLVFMSVQIEKLEKNMAKLTIEVPAEEFDAAMNKAYNKMRGSIAVPGFRKGKAPRKMIERVYGAAVFYEDAADILIPDAYEKALTEIDEIVVSRPSIDIVQIEAGKPFIFTAEVALKPEVTLGQYKGLEVEAVEVTVTEEEVQAEIDRERNSNARTVDVTDRPVQDGDMIKLDFDGSVDGEPFEGGKGEDYPLTIGSGSFIPGFEEQLIGKSIGEETEVHVTFPEDYHAEELKGKAAVFKCAVKSIRVKELPAEDDEFAQDVSDFDTMAEYREDVRAKLTERKTEDAKRMKEESAIAKAVLNATMDIPEAMIEEQARRIMDDFAARIQQQGIPMDRYLQLTGMTQEQLLEQSRPEALRRIQNSLVLEAVAKAEGIEISDERVDEELTRMAEQYKMEPEKFIGMISAEEREQIRSDLAVQAAAELIRDSAVEVAKKEEE